MDRDKVFNALRNCITEPKCKDCPWEECEQFDCKKTEIPVHLGLDILELLRQYMKDDECPCRHCMEWECDKVCDEYKKWQNAYS